MFVGVCVCGAKRGWGEGGRGVAGANPSVLGGWDIGACVCNRMRVNL